jgi:Coenzyme PQQ synthesis protein D (PqqD)
MYEVSPGVRRTHNEDGGIVLDITHGQMFRLNPVGALILELLGTGCAEADIARQIASRYGVDEKIAIADVHEFLESLEGHRLVHASEEGKTV